MNPRPFEYETEVFTADCITQFDSSISMAKPRTTWAIGLPVLYLWFDGNVSPARQRYKMVANNGAEVFQTFVLDGSK